MNQRGLPPLTTLRTPLMFLVPMTTSWTTLHERGQHSRPDRDPSRLRVGSMRRRQEAPNLNATTPPPRRATTSRPSRRACLRQRARSAVGVVERTLAASSTVSTDECPGDGGEDGAVGEGMCCSEDAGSLSLLLLLPTACAWLGEPRSRRLLFIGPRGRLGAWGSRWRLVRDL